MLVGTRVITGAVSQTANVFATQLAEELVKVPGFSVVAAVACFHAVPSVTLVLLLLAVKLEYPLGPALIEVLPLTLARANQR